MRNLPDGPLLSNPPLVEATDVQSDERDGLTGGTGHGCSGHPGRDPVAFGNLVFDDEADIRIEFVELGYPVAQPFQISTGVGGVSHVVSVPTRWKVRLAGRFPRCLRNDGRPPFPVSP